MPHFMRMAVRVMGFGSPGYKYLHSPVVTTVLGFGLGLGLEMPAGEDSFDVMGLGFAFGEAEPAEDGLEVLLDGFGFLWVGDGVHPGV